MKNIVPVTFIVGSVVVVVAEMIMFHSFWTVLMLSCFSLNDYRGE